jgi:hypothetical protein
VRYPASGRCIAVAVSQDRRAAVQFGAHAYRHRGDGRGKPRGKIDLGTAQQRIADLATANERRPMPRSPTFDDPDQLALWPDVRDDVVQDVQTVTGATWDGALSAAQGCKLPGGEGADLKRDRGQQEARGGGGHERCEHGNGRCSSKVCPGYDAQRGAPVCKPRQSTQHERPRQRGRTCSDEHGRRSIQEA